MRELFHGSTIVVDKPRVDVGRTNLDFGPAFYVTDIKEQACKWAMRPLNRRKEQWLSKYIFDETVLEDLGAICLIFERYDESWLDFIMASRRGQMPWIGYDYIEGGVADDRLFDTIEEYLDGRIKKETVLERLMQRTPNNQIAILNQDIIDRGLIFTGAEKLNDIVKIDKGEQL